MKPVNCIPKIKEIIFLKKSSSLLSTETKNDISRVNMGIIKVKKILTIIFQIKYIQNKKPQIKKFGVKVLNELLWLKHKTINNNFKLQVIILIIIFLLIQ